MKPSVRLTRRLLPTLAGVSAVLAAPVGWLLWRVMTGHASVANELAMNHPLYAYLTLGAAGLVATALAWWIRADRQLTAARLEIERISRSDAATGLFNAAGFQEAVGRYTALAARKGLGLAIVRVSISTSITGLAAADRVAAYRVMSKALRQGRRGEDLIGRLVKGEFAVLMPCADADGARVTIERMLGVVRAASFTTAKGRRSALGAAAGFSTLHSSEPAAQLARRAERALALAKKSGGKRVECLEIDEPLKPAAPQPQVIKGEMGARTLEPDDTDTAAAVETALQNVFDFEGTADEEPLFPIDIEGTADEEPFFHIDIEEEEPS